MIEDYLPHLPNVPKIKLPDLIAGILPASPGKQVQSNRNTLDAIVAAQQSVQNKHKKKPTK